MANFSKNVTGLLLLFICTFMPLSANAVRNIENDLVKQANFMGIKPGMSLAQVKEIVAAQGGRVKSSARGTGKVKKTVDDLIRSSRENYFTFVVEPPAGAQDAKVMTKPYNTQFYVYPKDKAAIHQDENLIVYHIWSSQRAGSSSRRRNVEGSEFFFMSLAKKLQAKFGSIREYAVTSMFKTMVFQPNSKSVQSFVAATVLGATGTRRLQDQSCAHISTTVLKFAIGNGGAKISLNGPFTAVDFKKYIDAHEKNIGRYARWSKCGDVLNVRTTHYGQTDDKLSQVGFSLTNFEQFENAYVGFSKALATK